MKLQKQLILLLFISLLKQTNAQLCFGPAVNYSAGIASYMPISADFNGDAKPDLAITNFYSSSVSILLGTGTGSFGVATNFSTDIGPQFIVCDDFNGDGAPDLAVSNFSFSLGLSKISILMGTGTGSFGPSSSFSVDNAVKFLVSGDFNSDGKVDLAACISGISGLAGNHVSILLGSGTGTFTAGANFPLGNNPSSIVGADFNGDGYIDLAATNGQASDVSVLLGIGNGSFGISTNYAVMPSPTQVISADLNGDGKLDLVIMNYSSNSVSTLLGTGTGSFGLPSTFPTNQSPWGEFCADFNGDGKLDLVTANYGSNDISILLGNGNGNFGAPTNIPIGGIPHSVTSADFDGNGKPDLAVTSLNQYLNVLLNKLPIISAVCSPSAVCPGQTCTLTATGASNYVWATGLSGPSVTIAPSTSTTFFVVGTLNGCSNIATVAVVVSGCVGINEYSLENELKVYPNPTKGEIFIGGINSEAISFDLFDFGGRLVLRQTLVGQTKINISEVDAGIYSMRIYTSEGPISRKLVLVN